MFNDEFKFYKAKCPLPDLSQVIDFDNINHQQITVNDENFENSFFGLVPSYLWKVFEVKDKKGLIFIKNPFNSLGQRYWISKCLRDYPNYNRNNLNSKNWWNEVQKSTNNKIKDRLRWCTLGYHHNWDTKIYNEEIKNEFPLDLKHLITHIATVMRYTNFEPQAAIVNYYPFGSTLAGHTDHSEINLEAPLFSISFGQTAIFLIGGKTKEEKPKAIFLKSGDILIMSKESRLSYHAVPKILESNLKPWNSHNENYSLNESQNSTCSLEKDAIKKSYLENLNNLKYSCLDENFWSPFEEYISKCRININVRQVLKNGQSAI